MVSKADDAVELEVRIAAKPETVFAFFTDPEKMTRWKGIEAALEPVPGGVYRVNINGRDIALGRYVKVVPHAASCSPGLVKGRTARSHPDPVRSMSH